MKELRVELKGLTDQGTFEGLLSPYNVVDSGADCVQRGAYAKTLREKGPERPLLWQHSSKDPIGKLTLHDRADGLYCTGELMLEDPTAVRAYRFAKAGICRGLSIGFISIKDSISNGIRYLQEISLLEGSIVTFPMAETALITSVKASTPGEREDVARLAREHLTFAQRLLNSVDGGAVIDQKSEERCSQLLEEMRSLLRRR